MAQPLRIDQLDAGSTLSSSADVAVVQSGATVRTTPAAFITEAASYTASGTGATARTVAGKLGDVIAPEDFGCVGDGSTDDSTNFAKAATAATGKTLKLTAGKTYILAAVDIPAHSSWTVVDMTGAIVKLKVLATTVGSPIFNVTGTGRVKFINGEMDGQKSSQPADGFSDSFNGGSNGLGRAFRSAIKADATVATGVSALVVEGVKFKNTYGAPVATLDVPYVRIESCEADTCNFELGYLYRSAATLNNAILLNNKLKSIGSGHASVNANGFVINTYGSVLVDGNDGDTIERNLVKFENCTEAVLGTNSVKNITKDNFSAIQVSLTTGVTMRSFILGTLNAYNVGSGIYLNAGGGTGAITLASLGRINVHTTTGSSQGDGFISDCVLGKCVIDSVNFTGIARNGLNISNTVTVLRVNGGSMVGSNTALGVVLNADGGSWGTVNISGLHVEDFQESAGGDAPFFVTRSSSNTIAKLIVNGCTILGGSSSNRGLSISADFITAGSLSDNYIDGLLTHTSAGLVSKDNIVTGTVTIPALTFVPGVSFGNGTTGITYGVQVGRYSIENRRVYFNARVTLTNKGSSSGAARITGLPFTSATVTNGIGVINVAAQALAFSTTVIGFVQSAASTVELFEFATGGSLAAITDADFGNTTDILVSGHYEIPGLTA